MRESKRVSLLVHPKYRPDLRRNRATVEAQVFDRLTRLGFDVQVVPVDSSLAPMEQCIDPSDDGIVFNLLEEFRAEAVLDFLPVAWAEAKGVPYTGTNPRGLVSSRNKYWVCSLARELGISTPYAVLLRNPSELPPDLPFSWPAIVKLNREHASLGIRRTSVVKSIAECRREVARLFQKYRSEVLVQEFVFGRDVSVSVLGNRRLRTFPPRWLRVSKGQMIATESVKFSKALQRRWNVRSLQYTGPAKAQLEASARKIFSALDLSGYARIDFRLDPQDQIFLIDVNANPNLCSREDFAQSAGSVGLTYSQLLTEIIRLGRSYSPRV